MRNTAFDILPVVSVYTSNSKWWLLSPGSAFVLVQVASLAKRAAWVWWPAYDVRRTDSASVGTC